MSKIASAMTFGMKPKKWSSKNISKRDTLGMKSKFRLVRVEILKVICPTYDNSVSRNDEYRLHKAFVYAVCSGGVDFKRSSIQNDKRLEDTHVSRI